MRTPVGAIADEPTERSRGEKLRARIAAAIAVIVVLAMIAGALYPALFTH